jgi:hypothetical protein
MVITVYTDRRSSEVATVALRLARALSALVGPSDVVLLGPRALGDEDIAVDRASLGESLSPADVGAMLGDLAARYAAAVVSLAGPPTEQVLAAFDASDRLLLLSDPSVASIRGTQRTLKLCRSLGFDAPRMAIVLRDFDDAPIAPTDAALAFKREIFWTLPGAGATAEESDAAYAGLARRLVDDTRGSA